MRFWFGAALIWLGIVVAVIGLLTPHSAWNPTSVGDEPTPAAEH